MLKIKILSIAAGLLILLSGCVSTKTEMGPASGLVTRVELGVRAKSVPRDAFSAPGEADGKGLLVTRVKPGTYAEALGIKTDDVLYTINGKRVTGIADSYEAMRRMKTQDLMKVSLFRAGKQMELSLKLKEGE